MGGLSIIALGNLILTFKNRSQTLENFLYGLKFGNSILMLSKFILQHLEVDLGLCKWAIYSGSDATNSYINWTVDWPTTPPFVIASRKFFSSLKILKQFQTKERIIRNQNKNLRFFKFQILRSHTTRFFSFGQKQLRNCQRARAALFVRKLNLTERLGAI